LDVQVGDVPGAQFNEVPTLVKVLMVQCNNQCVAMELRWQSMDRREKVLRTAALVARTVGILIRIHPFLNGNGRISRILWAALLHRFGLSPQARIVPRPLAPYGDVMAAAMQGDFHPLMAHIIQGMANGVPALPVAGP